MLVLSRQRDETVVLDFKSMSDADFENLRKTPIEVTTVDIRGNKVRTGFAAPKGVAVHRKEVFEIIRRENRVCPGKEGP